MRRPQLGVALAALLVAAWRAAAKPCIADMNLRCQPCFPMPGALPDCPKWLDECKALYCDPLCLRLLFKVKVSASGGDAEFAKQMGMRRYQQALAAQFQGMGCEETLGCCSKGPKIHEWVEHRTFGGYFPEPLLPLPYCRDFQGDRAQLCSMCEGAVQIELESLKDHCDYFQEWVDPLGKPKVRTPILQVFARSLVPGPQQIPMHKSFKERCVKMAAAAEGSFGAMKAAFMKKACKCLGCCEPAEGELACPFPAVYSTFEQAVHEYEKSRP